MISICHSLYSYLFLISDIFLTLVISLGRFPEEEYNEVAFIFIHMMIQSIDNILTLKKNSSFDLSQMFQHEK